MLPAQFLSAPRAARRHDESPDGSPATSSPTPMFYAESRMELAENILDEVLAGCAALAVRGESGSGKTSLMRLVATELQAHRRFVVSIGDLAGHPREVRRLVCQATSLLDTGAGAARLLASLTTERSLESLVVLVDQAENLPAEAFRDLWQLAGRRRRGSTAVQIVLFGALGAWPGLKGRDLEPLRKATQSCYILSPLRETEAEAYLDFRLRFAGRPRRSVMTQRAARTLLEHARYNPARINTLARQAVIEAGGSGGRRFALTYAPREGRPPSPGAPAHAEAPNLLTDAEIAAKLGRAAAQADIAFTSEAVALVTSVARGWPCIARSLGLRIAQATLARGGHDVTRADLRQALDVSLQETGGATRAIFVTLAQTPGEDMEDVLVRLGGAKQDEYGIMKVEMSGQAASVGGMRMSRNAFSALLAAAILGECSAKPRTVFVKDRSAVTYALLRAARQEQHQE